VLLAAISAMQRRCHQSLTPAAERFPVNSPDTAGRSHSSSNHISNSNNTLHSTLHNSPSSS
jgi:hypothetical protein